MSSKIHHPDFALRMQQACDTNPDVPQPNYGRLGWFVTQLLDRFQTKVTVETVRKWFAGEVRPRHKNVAMLAQILNVDEAWLSTGRNPEMTQKQAKIRNASADGAVNLVAGMIQIDGGNPAFPKEPGTVDLHAIIKGAMYNFHVSTGFKKDDEVIFSVPVDASDAFVIGIVDRGDLHFEVYELPWEKIESECVRNGAMWKVPLQSWARRITSFAERL